MKKMVKYTKRTKKYVKKSYTKRKSGPRKIAIRKMVKAEISRANENKCQQFYQAEQLLYSPANILFQTENTFPVGWDPASLISVQGTGQGNRIGNSVTMKNLTIKGSISLMPYDGVTNAVTAPYYVKCWIFYNKSEPTSLPNPLNNFFQYGNTTRPFQNNMMDIWSPVNTDEYRILKTKTYKIGYADAVATAGASQVNQYYSNNDFKMSHIFSFNLTKYYPKIAKFNDNNTSPMSRGLFMMWTFARADGVNNAGSGVPIKLQYMQDATFEDS